MQPAGRPTGDANENDKLDPTETWVWTCAKTITVDTDNTATADSNEAGPVTDTWSVTVVPSEPVINLVKSADQTALPVGGGLVNYTYTVTNEGNVPLTGVTLTDKSPARHERLQPARRPTGDANTTTS